MSIRLFCIAYWLSQTGHGHGHNCVLTVPDWSRFIFLQDALLKEIPRDRDRDRDGHGHDCDRGGLC